jgi:hypothetical protein
MPESDEEMRVRIEKEERIRLETRAKIEKERKPNNPRATLFVISVMVLFFAIAWQFMLTVAEVRNGATASDAVWGFMANMVIAIGVWLALLVLATIVNSFVRKP